MDFERQRFENRMQKYAEQLDAIRAMAHRIHADVNQHYDGNRPYGFHLDMVADGVKAYGHLVCLNDEDVLPLFFGAWFHDTIEDARLTYNDVRKCASELGLTDEQALMGAEIVYALTNDKGRTREERAGEAYYKGIRTTPYAPFVKMCDRLANVTFSFTGKDVYNSRMAGVYMGEMPHFIKSITALTNDVRYQVPQAMIERIYDVMKPE